MKHLLAIDQGTTGSTALLLAGEGDGRVLGRATVEFPQHFPNEGWVEHDTHEIWASVTGSIQAAYATTGLDPSTCAGIGITNQRETTVVWNRSDGSPIHRAIVWQDRRTAEHCAKLKADGHEAFFRAKTGLVLDPYFSGTKLAYILDTVDGARARAGRGELAFGTIDTWLVHKLSAGQAHVTDVSNASRTLLLDLESAAWDDELCARLNVPREVLPDVRGSSEVYAHTSGLEVLPDGIPIAGIAGDQQAALFGQTCFNAGEAKCTYGTGAFLLMNTGSSRIASEAGLLTTIAWARDGEVTYALEGSSFIAGAAVQWLRDGLGLIKSAADIEALAASVSSAGELVFVPALAGLGAPHWDPHARGLITGITRGTTAAHLARATLDGIAYQIADLVDSMERDLSSQSSAEGADSRALARLRVDGGASMNALLMQTQADLLGAPVDRPALVETTALGAAYLAGLAVGVYKDLDDIRHRHRIEHTFNPSRDQAYRDTQRASWRAAIRRTRSQT